MADGKIDPEHERHRGNTILDFGFVLKRVEIRILKYKGMKFYYASFQVAAIDFFGAMRSLASKHVPLISFPISADRPRCSIFRCRVIGGRTFLSFAAEVR